jgi:excisionase family DNA binding protein
MSSEKYIERSFCTTREAAEMLGVSLRTAQLWSESGLLDAWKTGGGHRRISRQSIERLLSGRGQ